MNWKKFNFLSRRNAAKPLIDNEYIEDCLGSSPVPIVLVIVLVWAVAAVLLLLSENRQRDLTVWTDGQRAPFPVWARIGFVYEDTTATKQARAVAAAAAPIVCRVDPARLDGISREFSNFFAALQLRENAENGKKLFSPGESAGSKLAAGVVDYRTILRQYKARQASVDQLLTTLLRHGVAGEKVTAVAAAAARRPVRVFTQEGRKYTPPALIGRDRAALQLARILDLPDQPLEEFRRCAEAMLGDGDLVYDQAASQAAADEAAESVAPVLKRRQRGDLLIERRQSITRETVDMLDAEKAALPSGYGIGLLGNRLIISSLLLAVGLFALYRTYPGVFRMPYRFSVAGAAVILSLLANYGALQLFFFFFRNGVMPDYDLMLFMMPIPFGAALLSVLMGSRTGFFAGILVAGISALMVLPDRSFELTLRWFAIGSLMTLTVRRVSNYRSFFLRVFLIGALLTAAVNSDVLYNFFSSDIRLLRLALITVAVDAFACAIAALLAVFALELIFNVETTMSLMVLSDYNHPLLEKLKREAPGTMFHCMTVATLAEDAARAIGASPARAKAGALFHDIGKIVMPQYFVENNVDSPKDHMQMPPQRSCGIIRGHVKEGLALARQYRLCRFIREAISTHHGDDLISFFYRRALENSEKDALPVLESQFRYDGKPPCGKELTIISLADACEAASRSLNKPSPAKLESLVNEIFIGRLRGGQLRNSELSLKELDTVRECFIADLISFNHGRIAYQKEAADDPAVLPLETPRAAQTEKK